MGKTVFDLYKVKINIFEYLFIFSFKQNQRICSPGPPLAGLKNVFVYCFIVCRVTAQIIWGPVTKERGHIETWNFGIGVQQQFGTTYSRMCSIFFFFKISQPGNCPRREHLIIKNSYCICIVFDSVMVSMPVATREGLSSFTLITILFCYTTASYDIIIIFEYYEYI